MSAMTVGTNYSKYILSHEYSPGHKDKKIALESLKLTYKELGRGIKQKSDEIGDVTKLSDIEYLTVFDRIFNELQASSSQPSPAGTDGGAMNKIDAFGKTYNVVYTENNGIYTAYAEGTTYKGSGKTHEEAFRYLDSQMNHEKADTNWS